MVYCLYADSGDAAESQFSIKDAKGEKEAGFTLVKSLDRAKEKKLLEGHTFYLSPKITPDLDIIKRIIEAAGGKVRHFTRRLTIRPADFVALRSTQRPRSSRPPGSPTSTSSPVRTTNDGGIRSRRLTKKKAKSRFRSTVPTW